MCICMCDVHLYVSACSLQRYGFSDWLESVHAGLTPVLMCIMSEHDLFPNDWYDRKNAGYRHPEIVKIDPVTGNMRSVEFKADHPYKDKVFKGMELIHKHVVNQQARDYWEINTSIPEWMKHNKFGTKKFKNYVFQEWNEVLPEPPQEEEEEEE